MINKTKYSSSLIISMIGSEAFKLGTAVYIYKFTNSFWLVSLLYLLMQVPTFISYLLNNKITKKWKLKNILFICDVISSIILGIILITYFVIQKYNQIYVFSIFLLVINIFLNIVHSFRFVALKSILYFISKDKKDIKTYNSLTIIATSISLLIGPIFSVIVFSKLPFWTLIVLNIITYLVSGILYLFLKTSEQALETIDETNENNEQEKQKNQKIKLKWLYTFCCSLIVGLFLFPKQSGMSQFFNEIKFDATKWSFILSIIFGSFGFVGSLISLVIRKKEIKLIWILIPMNILFLVLVPILFSKIDNNSKNIIYLISIGIQQLFYSLFISIFYTNTYLFFKEDKFKKNTIYTLIFRIISSSLIIILLTLITYKLNYFISFTIYASLILISSLLIIVFESKINKSIKGDLQNEEKTNEINTIN
ncbi:hypothetical protein ACJA25_01220 [Mycoplasmopsis hyopharyngis]|uniref:hypothetical protein n=1 Tax=Mycoplasmopsis hyopharyngis TaxID=29558 RepID=UPI003872CDC7